jgi:two-component system, LytTR family, response regulator AlgR
MSEQVALALIVAQPGPLQDSLQALLTSISQIEIVAEATDLSAILRMGNRIQPDIVLLDAHLPENEIWTALRQIQDEWSQTRTIVLVESSHQQQQAMDAGADVALPKGFPAAKFAATIEGLLAQ